MIENLLNILKELCDDERVLKDQDMELFDSGLLDSVAFAELLFEIEDAFGVIISPSEVSRENFNTPNKIMAEVQKRI